MPAKKPAAKKGPGAGALAKIKEAREKALAEEAARKAEEEAEQKRIEEEDRLAAEEAERRAEHKKATAGDREERKKKAAEEAAKQKKIDDNKKKLERLLASGMQVSDEMKARLLGDETVEVKREKVKTETLAQKRKRMERERAEREAAEAKEADEKKEAAAAAAAAKAKPEGEADDWEDEADDWDASEDKEEEEEVVEEAAPVPVPTKQLVPANAGASYADPMNDDTNHLRSPICCVLGHVDTGKTKLLDYIRRTNVQTGEAGGITQQIGASFFPAQNLIEKTAQLRKHMKSTMEIKVPGLLVIDTPGHEAFANLRGRGSALCDIAILVIDIMHGLEPQTKESIELLKARKCPFVVALNKIDRLYEWKEKKHAPFPITYEQQNPMAKEQFEKRLSAVTLELAECGLNSVLYTKNTNFLKYVSLVPTSAHTGEGVPDLLMLMVQLTQRHMEERLTISANLKCNLLEVKKIEGHGVTIDVILVDGVLSEGDTIVLCGLNGPIVTQIRALLTPHPMKEIRVKADYLHHKKIRAAQGIKIAATGMEEAVPGTTVLVCRPDDDIEKLQEEVMADLGSMVRRSQGDHGVCVQASTLGALEALLVFLKECEIPVSTVGVGELHKKDVMRAVGIKEKHPKYAVILCFDVEISKEAKLVSEKEEIRIFTADIIYNLQDKFKAYLKEYAQMLIEKNKSRAVFPVKMHVMKDKEVIRAKNPIVLPILIDDGQLRIGTPLFCWKMVDGKKTAFTFGKVEGMQRDFKEVKVAKKGEEVAVKIKAEGITFGRQVTEDDEFYSLITRDSIDALKESFKEEMEKSDWGLVVKLKKSLNIL